jgi:flavin-dependent dehydrogenase
MYDITIIGAGPAGSTLARLIAKTHKVLLIDKRTPDTDAKCCGGLLAPDAQQMLATLELGLPKSVLSEPQLFVVRAIDLPQRLEQYYQRHYINIDRLKFDQWLISLIPNSVDIRPGCAFQKYEIDNNGFKVHFTQGNRTFTEQTRIIIGADGAGSRVRRMAFPDEPLPKTYTAIQEWFKSEKPLPYFSSIFDSEITDFYSWIIPKANSIMLGSAIYPQPKSYRRFELLKKKLSDYGFKFGQSIKKRGTLLFRPVSAGQILPGRDNVGLIGEAAGFISPSSAEGISYALKSALDLGQALQAHPDNFLTYYCANTRGLRHNIRLKNLKSNFMYKPFLRRMIIRSGLNSIKISKD